MLTNLNMNCYMYVAKGVANTGDPLLQAVVQAYFVANICMVYVLEFNRVNSKSNTCIS